MNSEWFANKQPGARELAGWRGPSPAAVVVIVILAAWLLGRPLAARASEQEEDAAGFKAFSQRVEEYVRLHKSVESALPSLKPTDLPEMITAHQQALARKIREARPHAHPGDIFTHPARKAFHRAVRSAFLGTDGAHARATLQDGSRVGKLHLRVNQTYPEGTAYTTVPPTLLAMLPKLPDQVAYRIVGRDLVLMDVNANLVVDFIHEAVP